MSCEVNGCQLLGAGWLADPASVYGSKISACADRSAAQQMHARSLQKFKSVYYDIISSMMWSTMTSSCIAGSIQTLACLNMIVAHEQAMPRDSGTFSLDTHAAVTF